MNGIPLNAMIAALLLASPTLGLFVTTANAGWIENKSRMTFPTAYRGVWCNVGNDLFVKAKSETACPGRSGDFIYNITATGYLLKRTAAR
jgi:hypothetical protein